MNIHKFNISPSSIFNIIKLGRLSKRADVLISTPRKPLWIVLILILIYSMKLILPASDAESCYYYSQTNPFAPRHEGTTLELSGKTNRGGREQRVAFKTEFCIQKQEINSIPHYIPYIL